MTLSFLTIWVQLLEAWLALTSVKYLDNVSVLILLNRWLKLTMLVFIRHDIVNFVKSFVAWTTPGPSPLVLLFEERVHDLKVVGNDKVDKAPFLDLFYHHDRRRLDIIHLRLQLLR